ncbi:MAG: hypothetical protein ACFNUE_04785 [Bacteroides sp.]
MKRYRGSSSNPDPEALERLQRAELGLEEALQLHSTLEAEEQAEQAGLAGRTSTAPVCSKRLHEALRHPGVGGNHPLSYFEELCLREMDGELSPEERAELERLCGEYAIYARRRAVLERIVFRPDTTIVYRQKASLKRGVFTWHTGLVSRVAAAAAIVIGVLIPGATSLWNTAIQPAARFSVASKPESIPRVEAVSPMPAAGVKVAEGTGMAGGMASQGVLPVASQLAMSLQGGGSGNLPDSLPLEERAQDSTALAVADTEPAVERVVRLVPQLGVSTQPLPMVASATVEPAEGFYWYPTDWEAYYLQQELAEIEQYNPPPAPRASPLRSFLAYLAQRNGYQR